VEDPAGTFDERRPVVRAGLGRLAELGSGELGGFPLDACELLPGDGCSPSSVAAGEAGMGVSASPALLGPPCTVIFGMIRR